MEPYIRSYIEQNLELTKVLLDTFPDQILNAAHTIYGRISRGGTLYICGNGGSASDAQHIAAEFINRFCRERSPLPAVALTTDTSVLTSISNDYSFEEVFSKQVQALATADDVLLAISTSGTSPNIIRALQCARDKRCTTISLTGKTGGHMPQYSDISIIIPSDVTPIIQEMHLIVEHLICDLVEQMHIADSPQAT